MQCNQRNNTHLMLVEMPTLEMPKIYLLLALAILLLRAHLFFWNRLHFTWRTSSSPPSISFRTLVLDWENAPAFLAFCQISSYPSPIVPTFILPTECSTSSNSSSNPQPHLWLEPVPPSKRPIFHYQLHKLSSLNSVICWISCTRSEASIVLRPEEDSMCSRDGTWWRREEIVSGMNWHLAR